jgi:hypothetical protein
MTAPTNTNPALVLAWQIVCFSVEAQDYVCAFYCTAADGASFSTGFRPYTREARDNFKVKGDTWTRIESVPAHAEFIGRYETPASLRIRA